MRILIHLLKWGAVFSISLLLHFGCSGTDNEKKDSAGLEQVVVDTSGKNTSEVGTPGIAPEHEIEATEKNTPEETTEKVRGPENTATTEKSKTNKVKTDASVKAPLKDAKNDPSKKVGDTSKDKVVANEPPKAVKPDEPIKPEPTTKPAVEKTDVPVNDKPIKVEEPIKKEPENNPPKPATADQSNIWVVPEGDRKKANPVAKNSESINDGKALYQKHCASCHGKKGMGDGPKAAQLKTSCGDFTDPKVQAQTDGALFYKTRQGRDDMPSFKKKIPDEEEIWNFVNYLRTFK